jgi:hypothetical protein
MIRIYINNQKDVLSTPIESDSCKYMIQTYEGGWWFAEDNLQTGVRCVFQIQERIVLRKKNENLENSSEIILEVLKPLDDDFIRQPCWKMDLQEWALIDQVKGVRLQNLMSSQLACLSLPIESFSSYSELLQELPLSNNLCKLLHETLPNIVSNYPFFVSEHSVKQQQSTPIPKATQIPKTSLQHLNLQKDLDFLAGPDVSHDIQYEELHHSSLVPKAIQTGVLCLPKILPEKPTQKKLVSHRKDTQLPLHKNRNKNCLKAKCLINLHESKL